MGTVSAPALLGGLVDLDVLDNQVGSVETLGVGVGLSVLEETEKNLGGLDGPAGLGDTEGLACGSQSLPKQKFSPTIATHCSPGSSSLLLFQCCPKSPTTVADPCVRGEESLTLSGASSAAGVAPHGNSLLVLQDVTEVGKGALELPSVDGLGGLAGVLEGDTEVGTASAGALCVVEGGCSVTNLQAAINFRVRGMQQLACEQCDGGRRLTILAGDEGPVLLVDEQCQAVASVSTSKIASADSEASARATTRQGYALGVCRILALAL